MYQVLLMFSAVTQKIAKQSFVCVFFGSHHMVLVEVSNTSLIICSHILILQGQTLIWNNNFRLLLENNYSSVKYVM